MIAVEKGVVTQVTDGGEKCVVRPYGGGDSLTPELPVQKIKLTCPSFTAHGEIHPSIEWEELHPRISTGDEVAFVLFEDGTGLIIDKIAT